MEREQIFRAAVAKMAEPRAQDNVSRLFTEARKNVWYCFEQLALRGPRFPSAVIREREDGLPGHCTAHPDAERQCLHIRLATEPELRVGGGKVVWRGD
ncbi:hypothetical protein PG993_008700 [Apiospora rasikravindrae]|uniref:Uncharacterized protein n=1 Tax=Apiospora rasikravindrae TaxID=990691 RepID=A0ABR1SP21_9PEZI